MFSSRLLHAVSSFFFGGGGGGGGKAVKMCTASATCLEPVHDIKIVRGGTEFILLYSLVLCCSVCV